MVAPPVVAGLGAAAIIGLIQSSRKRPAESAGEVITHTVTNGDYDNSASDILKDSAPGTRVEWNDIHVTVMEGRGKNKKDKEILKGVSGSASPGRLLAILGPSGSGKTTLLNVIAGRLPRIPGARLTGTLTGSDGDNGLGYVAQDDIFFTQLTVDETLKTAAKLTLPTSIPPAALDVYVNTLITRLGLAKAAHTAVGGTGRERGVSGGERKRLSVGVELIDKPGIIVADEPTTGLDSFQAEKVMTTLHELAQEGRTVICSIHQPRGSIWELFDDVLLLAEGEIAYFGPVKECLSFFASQGLECPTHSNPADFCIDAISVDNSSKETADASHERIRPLIKAFSARQRAATSSALTVSSAHTRRPLATAKRRGWFGQFQLLWARAWRQVTRDKAASIARFASSVSSALIFGSIFHRLGFTQAAIQSRMGLLQVACINTAMSSLIKTLSAFPRERSIVDKERAKGAYSVGPYMAAKLAAELPVGALFPLLFGAIVYPLTGLNPSPARFARFLGIITLESFTSGALGLAVGAAAANTEAAMALGPAIMVVFIVFGGYYINDADVPRVLRWLPHTSLIKCAFEAASVNEFSGQTFEAHHPGDAATGEQVLRRLSFENSTLKSASIAQARILLFYYATTYAILRLKKPSFQPLEAPRAEDSSEAVVVAQ
eukprot:jgi/Chlat1/2867/Chrsp195S03022